MIKKLHKMNEKIHEKGKKGENEELGKKNIENTVVQTYLNSSNIFEQREIINIEHFMYNLLFEVKYNYLM